MTIDTSFHRAFDFNGNLRAGFIISENNEITANCSENALIKYICEDNLLSDQEINEKIQKIKKKWNTIQLPNYGLIDKVFQQLNPKDKRTLAIFLKNCGKEKLSIAEKEANYFYLVLNDLRTTNQKYAEKLEPFLTTDPHKVPLFINLLKNNQTELCDYLIDLSKKSDILESRKLIQAITNRLGDPNFEQIVKGVNEIITEKTSLLFLAKLIKHHLFLPIKVNSPELLNEILNRSGTPQKHEITLIKMYPTHAKYLEKYFSQLVKIDYALILETLRGDIISKSLAECLLALNSDTKLEILALYQEQAHLFILFDIYKDHPEKLLEMIRANDPSSLKPHLLDAGFPTDLYDKFNAGGNWDSLSAYRYLIYKSSSETLDKFDQWTRSFDNPVNDKHPYYPMFERVAAYLAEYPERADQFLEIVKKDPHVAIRLIESKQDFTELKKGWQFNYFLTVLKRGDFSPKKMKRLYHVLLTHPMVRCSQLVAMHGNNRAVFNALLKASTNPTICSPTNLDWMIQFAFKNPELSQQLSGLFGRRLVYNEQEKLVNLNILIDEMKKQPTDDLKKALIVFSRSPEVLYLHLTKGAIQETETLMKFYEIAPNEDLLIDRVCRLITINDREVLSQVMILIEEKKYSLASSVIDLVFTGEKTLALAMIAIRHNTDKYSIALINHVQGDSADLKDFYALGDNNHYRAIFEIEPSMATTQGFIRDFKRLNEDEQLFVYQLFQKKELTRKEVILKDILRAGNVVLFKLFKESDISVFDHLDFSLFDIQLFLEQVYLLLELLKLYNLENLNEEAMQFSLSLYAKNTPEQALIIISKLICCIDANQGYIPFNIDEIVMSFRRRANFTANEYDAFRYGDKYIIGYHTKAETLLCDALPKLLILKNNRLNIGLSQLLLRSHLYQLEDLNLNLRISNHASKMLSLFAGNREFQSVLMSIQVNPDNKDINEFIRKCLKIPSEKPLSSTDCQVFALSAMLAYLKQDDFGSCFVTNVSIQIQNTQPLQKLLDLKEIIEKQTLSRVYQDKVITYPLVYPDYIFSSTPRSQQGLIQLWDLTIANMAGAEERMFARMRNPMRHFISKALRKLNPQETAALSELILNRFQRDMKYLYEPVGKGTYYLHYYSPETKSWTKFKDENDFISVLQTMIQRLKEENTGIIHHYLDYLNDELFKDPQFNKKLEEWIKVTSLDTSQKRLTSKENKKKINAFAGGYGASVLRSYLGSPNLYEETFTGHTPELILYNLLDLRNSLPPKGIVSVFTMGHVNSFVKDHSSLVSVQLGKLKTQGENLLKQPFQQYLPLITRVINNTGNLAKYTNLISKELTKIQKDIHTLKDLLRIIPTIIEKITGSTQLIEEFCLNVDSFIMSDEYINKSFPIIQIIYTNWGRSQFRYQDEVFSGRQNWGFGFRPSVGEIGVYKVSSDKTDVVAKSMREIFKTYKIRFVVPEIWNNSVGKG